VVLAVKLVVGNRLAGRWHYYLWLLVVFRMLMPWAPESRISMFNLIPDSLQFKRVDFISGAFGEANIKSAEAKAGPGGRAESADYISKTDLTSSHSLAGEIGNWSRTIGRGGGIFPFLWLAGVVVLLTYMYASNVSLWSAVKCERALTEQRILDLLENCKAEMGVRTVLGVAETDGVKSPALFGFIRPRLVLPRGILEGLSHEELRHIFLHELAHLKRHDIFLSWVTSLLLVVHWFNPLVWYAFYRMRQDRELACDDLTLSAMDADESCEYGRTMVRVLERFCQSRRLPILAGVVENKSELERRITMISRFKKQSYRWSVLGVVLIAVVGCATFTEAEKTAFDRPVTEPGPAVATTKSSEAKRPAPKIVIEKGFHHFGEIGPGTENVCEFKFRNAGDSLLKITRVETTCGCMVANLSKKEYGPGEIGTVSMTYRSSKQAGSARKHFYIHSNDKANAKARLTVRANIVLKVDHEPKKLGLSFKAENAGCPALTLSSRDNKPFSIKGWQSTGNSVTADYESSVEKTEFVLRPKVDIVRLRNNLNGQIKISVTHPECDAVVVPFEALAEYEVSPASLIIFDAEPKKPVIREVWVLNNYGDDFEIYSVSAEKCCILKVLSQEKIGNRYKLTVQITPPAANDKARSFTDVLHVKIKGHGSVESKCRGLYGREKK
jgi:bla regulator protein BlaR1